MTQQSLITLTDGTVIVEIDGYATSSEIRQRFTPVPGGSAVTRFQSGAAIKQTVRSARKMAVEINAAGWAPPSVWGLDFSKQMTLTIQDRTGPMVLQGYCAEPDEEWNLHAAEFRWVLRFEES